MESAFDSITKTKAAGRQEGRRAQVGASSESTRAEGEQGEGLVDGIS